MYHQCILCSVSKEGGHDTPFNPLLDLRSWASCLGFNFWYFINRCRRLNVSKNPRRDINEINKNKFHVYVSLVNSLSKSIKLYKLCSITPLIRRFRDMSELPGIILCGVHRKVPNSLFTCWISESAQYVFHAQFCHTNSTDTQIKWMINIQGVSK